MQDKGLMDNMISAGADTSLVDNFDKTAEQYARQGANGKYDICWSRY